MFCEEETFFPESAAGAQTGARADSAMATGGVFREDAAYCYRILFSYGYRDRGWKHCRRRVEHRQSRRAGNLQPDRGHGAGCSGPGPPPPTNQF